MKRVDRLKKILSLVLACGISMSLMVPAFAESAAPPSGAGTGVEAVYTIQSGEESLAQLEQALKSQRAYVGDYYASILESNAYAKEAYTALLALLKKGHAKNQFEMELTSPTQDFGAAVNLVLAVMMHDHPELLVWYDKVQGTPILKQNNKLCIILPVADGYKGSQVGSVVNIPVYQIIDANQRIDQAKAIASEMVAEATGDAAAKYQSLFTALLSGTSYDDAAAAGSGYGDAFQMTGALIDKKAVCEGFAKAYKYLCDQAGLDCVLIEGVATDGGTTEAHMWNYVKLGGKWFLVDPTWSVPPLDSTTYFLKGKNSTSDHTPETDISYPELNATDWTQADGRENEAAGTPPPAENKAPVQSLHSTEFSVGQTKNLVANEIASDPEGVALTVVNAVSSDNATVSASVAGGVAVLTGNTGGTANVTVSVSDGTNTTACTIAVTVKADTTPPVNAAPVQTLSTCAMQTGDSREISAGSIALDPEGETLSILSATVQNGALAAATVSGDGSKLTLLASGQGETVVTVHVYDGTNSTACAIRLTVTARPLDTVATPTGITIGASGITLPVYRFDETVTLALSTETADAKLYYSLGDASSFVAYTGPVSVAAPALWGGVARVYAYADKEGMNRSQTARFDIRFSASPDYVPPYDDDDDDDDSRSDRSSGHAVYEEQVEKRAEGVKLQADIRKNITKNADGTKSSIVTVTNCDVVSPSALRLAATAAQKEDVAAMIYADVRDGKTLKARLYLDPTKAAGIKNDIRLGVDVDTDFTARVEKNVGNNVKVIRFQQANFGMKVDAALKLSLNGMDTKALKFYSRDSKGALSKVEIPYWIDANGFLHITTQIGGVLVISDKTF